MRMSTVYLSFRHPYTVLRFTPSKFPEAFGAQVFKHRHQEVITKVDETSFSFVENAVARKESLAFSDNLNTLNLKFGRLICPKPHSLRGN